jgi:hypothetical protein
MTAGRLVMSLTPPPTVGKLQATLHAKAKGAPTYRFYALYDKIYRADVLAYAYACCKANGGAAGVDGQTHENFTQRLLDLTRTPRSHAANRRLAAHLYGHGEQWFMFLLDPSLPATNYRGEQAIRPAVVNRKVWGGNRTNAGASAQATIMSVLQTCKQQAIDAFSYLSKTLCGFVTSLFAPLQMAPAR